MWIDEAALANIPEAGSNARPSAPVQRRADPGAAGHQDRVPPAAARAAWLRAKPARAGLYHLPVPNYTTLSRRAQTLGVQLPVVGGGEPIHLVDSTGVKVYGEGEWKVRQDGYSKRRTGRKVHLGLNANTAQARAALMTHQDVVDGDVWPELLGQTLDDTKPCHAAIAAHGATPSIPPREGAAHWPTNTPGATWRDDAVGAIARLSRREWKKDSGYHRRLVAENAMYRFKTLSGNCLWARPTDSQAAEVAVRVGVINRMADLARPQSVRIG